MGAAEIHRIERSVVNGQKFRRLRSGFAGFKLVAANGVGIEADSFHFLPEVVLFEAQAEEADLFRSIEEMQEGHGSGDALAPQILAVLHGFWHLTFRDDIGDHKAAAGFEDAVDLPEDFFLAGRQVDDAVRGDHVRRGVFEGDGLQEALLEFHVAVAQILGHGNGVLTRHAEHFIGHVDAVNAAAGADALGGDEAIDAAPGAQIDQGFSGREVGAAHRAAAAVGNAAHFLGDVREIVAAVIGGAAQALLRGDGCPGIKCLHIVARDFGRFGVGFGGRPNFIHG